MKIMIGKGHTMLYKCPRGRSSWLEYFMFKFLGITFRVNRKPSRKGITFAAQEHGLFGSSLVISLTMNHFHWIYIDIYFRHVAIWLGFLRPFKNTGFPTLTFRTPWTWHRKMWKGLE